MAEPELKRNLSFPLLTMYGIGSIVGAGIYVLVGKVAGIAGMFAPVAFMLSALLAGFTGYSYARLAARYPISGGEALYVDKAFSRHGLSALVGWMVIATGVISSATLCRGFASYLSVFVSGPHWLFITLLVIVITSVACWGIRQSALLAAAITAIEIVGLVLILILLGDNFAQLPEAWDQLLPDASGEQWLAITAAAFLAFYAFIGFEDMINIAEEVLNPSVVLPLAILTALGLATLLYVLVALVAVLHMPVDQLAASDAPMVAMLEADFPFMAQSLGIISLIAIVNGALAQTIMGSRILYGMSRKKLTFALFNSVNPLTHTPVRATIAIALLIWIPALLIPLTSLAKLTSFVILIVFALVNTSLLVIQRRERMEHSLATGRADINAAQLVEILLPLLGVISCIALLGVQSWLIIS